MPRANLSSENSYDKAAALPSSVVSNLPRVSDSGAAVEHALENVGESLTALGKTLFAGTKGIFEQVRTS